MRKLVVVHNIPNPHRVALFEHLAHVLGNAGWSLEVVFGSRLSPHRRWKLDASSFRFRHRFLEGGCVSLAPDRVWHAYRGVTRALREIRPDALVSLGFSTATMVGTRYARKNDIPIAIWSGALAGRESGFLRRAQRQWLVGQCDGFLAYGSAARDYLIGLGAPADRVHLAWNTLDVSRFLAVPDASPPRNQPRLLYVGTLEPGKRVDLLLEVVRRSGATLEIVGDGTERKALQSRAEGLPVVFSGHLDYRRIPACFARAHAFAFPAQHDVWGLALVEALAAGRPALASSRAGATRDLIVDGENGFAVDFADIDSVVARLARLDIQPMGIAARRRIRERFTLDDSARGWQELVNQW